MIGNECDYNNAVFITKLREKITKENNKMNECKLNIDIYTDCLISKVNQIRPIISANTLNIVWNNFTKKEKPDNYKMHYDFIVEMIKDHIIGNTECSFQRRNFIKDIIICGYDGYAYSIYFTIDGIDFIFSVPNPQVITKQNLPYAYDGMYALGFKNGKNSSIITKQSYILNDLHEAFNEIINNKEIIKERIKNDR